MPSHLNATSLWSSCTERCLDGTSRGSRDGACNELLFTHDEMPAVERVVNSTRRGMSAIYAGAEFLWYLTGTMDISMIKAYAPSYEKYANNGLAWGAYGARWLNASPGIVQEATRWARTMDGDGSSSWTEEGAESLSKVYTEFVGPNPTANQVSAALAILASSPDSRQCVLTCYDSGDLLHAVCKDKGDIPCTLSLQFLARDGLLHLCVTMRSNDVWRGMPYDIYAFTGLQRLFAWVLGLKAGSYVHQAGSLHLYDRDVFKIGPPEIEEPFVGDPYASYEVEGSLKERLRNINAQLQAVTKCERGFRENRWQRVDIKSIEQEVQCPLLRDALLSCVHKWCRIDPEWIVDLNIRKLLTNADIRRT